MGKQLAEALHKAGFGLHTVTAFSGPVSDLHAVSQCVFYFVFVFQFRPPFSVNREIGLTVQGAREVYARFSLPAFHPQMFNVWSISDRQVVRKQGRDWSAIDDN